MEEKERDRLLDRLAIALDRVFHRPRLLLWRGFILGFASGIGAAFAIILIGFMVNHFGGIPLVGDFLQRFGQAVPSN